jgi:hypothetical protein
MSESFTHARCGGVLVEIPKPDWWDQFSKFQHWFDAMLARCERCGLAGEVIQTRSDGEIADG